MVGADDCNGALALERLTVTHAGKYNTAFVGPGGTLLGMESLYSQRRRGGPGVESRREENTMFSRLYHTGQSDRNGLAAAAVERRVCDPSRCRPAGALIVAALAALAPSSSASVTPYLGVQAQLWRPGDGVMKMDYDWARSRFVVQYHYRNTPPEYATIDLATKALTPFATTEGEGYETLLTVLPSAWSSFPQGTTLLPSGGGGKVLAVPPAGGSYTTFAAGLPAGGAGPTHYATVRWDEFGAAGHDLLYANEGTGDVLRINSAGTTVWSSMVRLPDGSPGRPEAVIALGSNPRWGPYQNSILVGENAPSTNVWQLDPTTGAPSQTQLGVDLGRTAESFRVYPFSGGNVALYLSVYNDFNQNTIWQLTNLSAIPNFQPGDLFVAIEEYLGGEVWHVYFDQNNNPVYQKIVDIVGDGFLEDMVFAPVPEPGTWGGALLGALCLLRRR